MPEFRRLCGGTHFAQDSSKRYTRRVRTLEISDWQTRATGHAERADSLTAAHRARAQRREGHPIEDFLFTYYSIKPSELRRWHPGAGVTLAGADGRKNWRYYAFSPVGEPAMNASPRGDSSARGDSPSHDSHSHDSPGAAFIDLPAFFARRGATVDYVEQLLSRTLEHEPRFACFGLHEWAMVYRQTPDQLRHRGLALRIGHEATDRVVETHTIACSHFDAFRFFTPEAAPLNRLQPTRETQPDLEQSGCLHAGMDIYKWCGKLGPIVPGELLLDAFELARDIREVDMQASPYDVSGYGLSAIPIETPEGKREYADRQRAFARRGNALRERTLAAISTAREALATWRHAP